MSTELDVSKLLTDLYNYIIYSNYIFLERSIRPGKSLIAARIQFF